MATVKRRWPLELAELTAQVLVSQVGDVCERIEVAGSVRRGRMDVGDIELLCIPRQQQVLDLFGRPVEVVCELVAGSWSLTASWTTVETTRASGWVSERRTNSWSPTPRGSRSIFSARPTQTRAWRWWSGPGQQHSTSA